MMSGSGLLGARTIVHAISRLRNRDVGVINECARVGFGQFKPRHLPFATDYQASKVRRFCKSEKADNLIIEYVELRISPQLLVPVRCDFT